VSGDLLNCVLGLVSERHDVSFVKWVPTNVDCPGR